MNLFSKAKENGKEDDVKICLYCGDKFKPRRSDLNRGWGIYCSKSCSVKWKNENKSSDKNKRKSMNRDKKLNQLGI